MLVVPVLDPGPGSGVPVDVVGAAYEFSLFEARTGPFVTDVTGR